MDALRNPSRRRFLKVSTAVTGGLLIGFHLPAGGRAALAAEQDGPFEPNAHLRIDPDGAITVIVGRSEMGQGVHTSLPMLIAEELEADWEAIRVAFAPVAPAYRNTQFGIQATGGSTSVVASWKKLRQAGAAARIMLIEAAVDAWGVDPEQCTARQGAVHHAGSGRSLGFGELAGAAAMLPPPVESEIALKPEKEFRIIGKPRKRLDSADKVTGRAGFGLDVKLDGLLTALIERPPVFGASVKSYDDTQAMKVPGVKKVVQVPSGVAVLAEGFWPASQGRKALKVEWEPGALADLSSQGIDKRMRDLAASEGVVARDDGEVQAALAGAQKKVQAEYRVPYLAHACMEPLNATVRVDEDRCEIWTGTQFQEPDTNAAAKVLGIDPSQVTLHTRFLGGGFGRRGNPHSDFVVEAVHVAKAVAGTPVKVIWTREDDTRGGFYRPAAYNRLSGAVDGDGNPVAWSQRIVCQSIMRGTMFESVIEQKGYDPSATEGADSLPYAIPNLKVDWQELELGVPVLWWRSVGHSTQGFVTESFMDELAHAAGRDPYQFRRALLEDQPRVLRVLEAAADKAGWDKPRAEGRGRGIAVHESFGSVCAQVAEVSVASDGTPRVHKVVCAVDCGLAVNPLSVEAQAQSAINFALTAVLYGEISFQDGRVQQDNFDDYQMLRIHEAPEIKVHIVQTDADAPTGMGEPAVPPLAAAVGNAMFDLTGKRVRSLPIDPKALRAG